MVVSREAIERSMTIVTLFADSLLLHSYCQDYSQVLRIDCFLIELSALAAYENDAAAPFIKTPGLESKICRFALIDYRWLSFRTDLLCFSALLVRMVREKERGKFVALYSDCLHTSLVPTYVSQRPVLITSCTTSVFDGRFTRETNHCSASAVCWHIVGPALSPFFVPGPRKVSLSIFFFISLSALSSFAVEGILVEISFRFCV